MDTLNETPVIVRKRRKRPSRRERAERKQIRWFKVLLCAGLILLITGGAVMAIRLRRPKTDTNGTILIAQHFVKGRVGPNFVTNFSPPEWTKVERNGDNVEVSGWFQVIPKAGGPAIAYSYDCTLNDGGGSWALTGLDLMKQ